MNSDADSNEEGMELQAVLGDYFDALLHDSSELPAQSVTMEAVTVPAATVAVMQIDAEAAPLPAVTDREGVPVSLVSEATLPTHDRSTVAETETAASAAEQAHVAPGYQLIRLGGLTLGIPMHAIVGVVTAPPQWTPLGDARAWVLGSYSDRSASYTVVDTAALLVPGGTLQAAAVGSNAVLLAGQRWALACDGIGAQITPARAQVNWRGAQGKRPWLAGTLRAPTCALLDIPELIRLLEA